MHEPESLNFISVWIIYYDGELSYVQNKIIFVDDFASKINEYVNERELLNEDGFKISEWIVKTKDVIDFYDSIIGLI
jgi:raw score 3.69